MAPQLLCRPGAVPRLLDHLAMGNASDDLTAALEAFALPDPSTSTSTPSASTSTVSSSSASQTVLSSGFRSLFSYVRKQDMKDVLPLVGSQHPFHSPFHKRVAKGDGRQRGGRIDRWSQQQLRRGGLPLFSPRPPPPSSTPPPSSPLSAPSPVPSLIHPSLPPQVAGDQGAALQRLSSGFVAWWAGSSDSNRRQLMGLGLPQAMGTAARRATAGGRELHVMQRDILR